MEARTGLGFMIRMNWVRMQRTLHVLETNSCSPPGRGSLPSPSLDHRVRHGFKRGLHIAFVLVKDPIVAESVLSFTPPLSMFLSSSPEANLSNNVGLSFDILLHNHMIIMAFSYASIHTFFSK